MATLSCHQLPQWLALHKVAHASLRPSAFIFLRLAAMSISILHFCPLDRRVRQSYSRCGSLSQRRFPSMSNTPQRRPRRLLPFYNVDLDVAGKVLTTVHVGILANQITSYNHVICRHTLWLLVTLGTWGNQNGCWLLPLCIASNAK